MGYTPTPLTSFGEVFIDKRAARSPCFLSANLTLLAVQPGGEIWGVIRGLGVEDVIDIPRAGKGTKDLAVAVALSLTASGIGSSIGTTEDLNWS